jgi:RNA polymerase sigma-70 factor (ECF subfamily)
LITIGQPFQEQALMPIDPTSLMNVQNEQARALAAALGGDPAAFAVLTDPFRRELMAHCYRMLGSLQDAEDLVQETFLRAWRRLETYEGRASFRAWLYKISTNACLDVLERRPRRSLPITVCDPTDPQAALPAPVFEPVWLDPYPDELLVSLEANPEALYEKREKISLAFMVALQVLPPRQRCVLILSDVLDWGPAEIADLLDITLSAANSLLYRARKMISRSETSRGRSTSHRTEREAQSHPLLERYLRAWEDADIAGIVSLLTEDATFPMPPLPVWYQGRAAIGAFISATILTGQARGRFRLLPVRANGQPGFAFYQLSEPGGKYQAYVIQVLSIQGDLVSDATTFGFPYLFKFFNLPEKLES